MGVAAAALGRAGVRVTRGSVSAHITSSLVAASASEADLARYALGAARAPVPALRRGAGIVGEYLSPRLQDLLRAAHPCCKSADASTLTLGRELVEAVPEAAGDTRDPASFSGVSDYSAGAKRAGEDSKARAAFKHGRS